MCNWPPEFDPARFLRIACRAASRIARNRLVIEEAAEQAASLLAWLDEGNSPPETALTTPFGMGDPWDEAVTRAVCNLILSMPPDPGSNPASQ